MSSGFLGSVVQPGYWNPANRCLGTRPLWFLGSQSHQGVPRVPRWVRKRTSTSGQTLKWPDRHMTSCLFPLMGEMLDLVDKHTHISPDQDPMEPHATESICDLPEEASRNGCLLLSLLIAAVHTDLKICPGPWNVSWGKGLTSKFGLRSYSHLGTPNVNPKDVRRKITNPNHHGQIN